MKLSLPLLGFTRGADTADAAEPTSAPAPLLARLKAWWAGYEIETSDPAAAPAPRAPAQSSAPVAAPAPSSPPSAIQAWTAAWSGARIRAAERVWGAGFISPGGADVILDLVKPLVIMPQHSVLDLHAGVAGPARAIAETFGVWVTGFEASRDLVARAAEENKIAGMVKRAPVTEFDPEAPLLKKKGFDRVFSKELLFQVARKAELLAAVAAATKSDGQLVLTDYVLGDGADDGFVDAWSKHEPIPPCPVGAKKMQELLKQSGFDVRTAEDMTDRHAALVVAQWDAVLKSLRPRELEPEVAVALIREAEIWAARAAAFASGRLRCYRFFALRRGK